MELTRSAFAFLTSGPVLDALVPSVLDGAPELNSPIVSGIGARSWVFTPSPQGDTLWSAMDNAGVLVEAQADRDGRSVDVLERKNRPLVWWLRWRLTGGCLTTHLREADGLDRVNTILEAISIVDESPTPLLMLDPPLRPMASHRLGYQESALLVSGDRSTWLKFVRPGFLEPGKIATATTDSGGEMFRGGIEGDIEIQLTLNQPAEDALDTFETMVDAVRIS